MAAKGSVAACARLNQGAATPGMGAGCCPERLGGSEGLGRTLPLGLTEQGADQPVEHLDRGVGKLRLHLDGEGGEDREPPGGLEAGEVLGAHRPRRAGDEGIAGLVDAPGVRGLDRQGAHRLEPLDDPGEIGRGGRFRPFPQPGEARAGSALLDREEPVQPLALLRREAGREIRRAPRRGRGPAPRARSARGRPGSAG